jgi:hypothetical protein
MSRPIHKIYQGDGTFIERPFTDEEMVVWEKDQADEIARKQAIIEAEAKRAAAEAKLAALGLTSDDLKALGL